MKKKKLLQKFIASETSGGFCLFLITFIALVWSNSPFYTTYAHIIATKFTLSIGVFTKDILLSEFVNDGLMTLFFFLIGLEIKRELLVGELNSFKKAALPGIAAVGGMIVPALIYLMFNIHDPIGAHGWAIPMATDIAFSLAVLSLLGNRVPISLKIFLTALAIFDDLGAVCIIAIFYTHTILWQGIVLAALFEGALIGLNKLEIVIPVLYFLVGFLIWLLFAVSGIHPTLAGILVAFTVPLSLNKKSRVYPAHDLEQKLHPWVIFFILPLFAFINVGVSLQGLVKYLMMPVSLGIMLGLFFGKQLGIFSFCWLAVRSKVAQFPRGMDWSNLYGVALLCGIGFTMSFFIGFLSFDEAMLPYQNYLRAGVLCGSLLSGLSGYCWLYFQSRILNK
jgi:Na+:H+ antiporter, NhaA family